MVSTLLPLPSGQADPLVIAEGSWHYEGVEHPFSLAYLMHEDSPPAVPVAVYLNHLDRPRLGRDSDEQIQADLLEDGLAVIDLDCSRLPSQSMAFERALLDFHGKLQAMVKEMTSGQITLDYDHLYWLPEGYRLARNLAYWNIEKHGAFGTMEWIMDVHNRVVVERHGVEPVESVEDLSGPGGRSLDYNLYIDIMYPSGDVDQPVPTIAQFATICRMPRTFRSGERPMEPIGWLTSGYALAYIDHAYNPQARRINYRYFQPYTIQDHNDVAVSSAAIRFLRAHADQFNLSDRIGALGHSKSSYSTIRLADPRHPEQQEHSRYHGFPEGSPEPQPWPDYSSEIHVAFASMGNGTRRTQYIDQAMVPLIVAVGRSDRFGHWNVFPRLVAACEKEDLNHLALWMDELGHDRPFGTDRMTGAERHLLIRQFFGQHLHPHGEKDLQVLFTLPHDGAKGVRSDGITRILTRDEDLPDNMRGLSPYRPITVRFARSIDLEKTPLGSIYIHHADTGEHVSGIWSPSLQNSALSFTPDRELKPNSTYNIVVRDTVRDVDGQRLAVPVIHTFHTAGQ